MKIFRIEVDYKENSDNEPYFVIGSNFLIPKEPLESLIKIHNYHHRLVDELISKKQRDKNQKKGYYDQD